MLINIPLRQIPGQSFLIRLNDQNCSIRLTQRLGKTYSDLMINNTFVWEGLICQDRSPILKHSTKLFVGNLVFVDLEGREDPHFERLGERWKLFYITDDIRLADTFQTRGTERR